MEGVSRPFSLVHLLSLSLSISPLLLSPLSNNDNDHSSSRLSLSVNTALTCQSVRVHGPWSIPCWPTMFAACKKQLSWYNCASLVPLGMKWACICAGNGCCVWWCLVVLLCGSMCYNVLVCVVFVVLLVASVLASMRWLLCGGDGSKKKTTSEINRKMSRERIHHHCGFN